MEELTLNYATMLPQVLTAMGIISCVVSAITEVTKKIPAINQIPTDLVVVVLSELFTVMFFIAYMQYNGYATTWYLLTGSVVVGMLVAFVTMFGWTKFNDIFGRYAKL